jgi:hypothetical protein
VDGFVGRVMNENGRVPTKIFDHWERVLYAFYGTEIRISDADMGAALNDCVGLIQVAEYLDCMNLIGRSSSLVCPSWGNTAVRM